MMKHLRSKSKAIVALVLVLTIAVTLVALPAVSAQPTKKTYAYIGAVPNPVGKGQQVLLHIGITDYLTIATDGWEGLWVSIEKPDNTTEKIENIKTDSTGGTGRSYTPDQEGTYYLQTHFPEQVYNWTTPPIFDPTLSGPVTYLASTSEKLALVVQQEAIPYYPASPLPTEYWSRPIDAQLREWYKIAGSWLTAPPNLFAPYNDGPESAHILWAKPLIRGGLSGGDTGEQAHDCGDAYRGRWQSPIIMEGVVYYRRFPSSFFAPLVPEMGTVAVDLHTGEELWVKPNLQLAFGQTLYFSSMNMHGTFSYLWETVGNTWNAYEPSTGDWVYTMQNVPSGTMLYGPDGEILIYSVDLANGFMTMWNSTNIPATRAMPSTEGMFGFTYYTWAPEGKTMNLTGSVPATPTNPGGVAGYQWNVSIPTGLPGGVAWVLEDRIIGSNVGVGELGVRAPPELVFWGISTKPGDEGTLLFNETWTTPTDVVIGHVATSLEDEVFVLWVKETREHYGFSLDTGKYLWGPTEPQYYLDSIEDTPQNSRLIADGKFYSASVSGIAYCYDVKNGTLLWTYEAADPYQEILWANNWWLRPLFVTDGKIYLGHSEHSAIDPKPRGAPFICLDATTGDEIFRIDGAFRSTRWGGRAIIGDSIIATQDTYDQNVYAIGMGPSATTVTAPDTVLPLGTGVMIKGTVTDVSPGTKEPALTARFPNGVPAIADEDMSEWMLYVYKQFAVPMDVTGVLVYLDAVDPNGNFTNIGTTTSDMSGMFKKMWTPETEGEYTIIATFAGSKSYYASYAETAIGVGPAPPEAPPPPPEEPAYTAIDLAIIAAIVVVAILVLYTLYTVRKRH